jgi:hypothetical protein
VKRHSLSPLFIFFIQPQKMGWMMFDASRFKTGTSLTFVAQRSTRHAVHCHFNHFSFAFSWWAPIISFLFGSDIFNRQIDELFGLDDSKTKLEATSG